jgi:D-alanine-D-alanine ligase
MSARSGTRIAVVMGGPSGEREVSLQTGAGVVHALQELGYDARALDYDDRFVDAVRALAPEAVFIALHGPAGEDGQIQAVLEHLRIPYTGSGVAGSALAIDKHLTKKLLAAEGLPTPSWELFDLDGGSLPLLPGALDLPLVVKPRHEGSSLGVRIVRTHDAWTQAMLEASHRYAHVIAEEYVEGREFSVAVLGDEALPVIEIIPETDDFYSYDAKYAPGGSTHVVPARIDDALAARLQVLALSAHRLLGLRDYSRTDILVNAQGRPYILEVNSLPGLTATSLLPDAARAAGMGYEALVERLVGFALKRRATA